MITETIDDSRSAHSPAGLQLFSSFLSTQRALPQNCKVGDLPFNGWMPHER